MQEWKYATALRTLGVDLFVTQLCQNPGKQLMFKPVDKGGDQKSNFTAKKKWGKKALMARLGRAIAVPSEYIYDMKTMDAADR